MTGHSEILKQNSPHLYGETLASDLWARKYGPWIVLGFTATFTLFLIGMNLTGQVPGRSFVLKGTSDILQFIGEGIGCFFCIRIAIRLHKVFVHLRRELRAKETGRQTASNLAADRTETQSAYRAYLAWTFIAIAVALYAAGQAIWTSYDVRMNSADVPFPGLYDLGFVASYAFFLVGTLLLTRRSKAIVRHTYLMLDALAIIGASLALSWFFLLGPSIAGIPQTPNPGAAFLSIYFPTGDLFLVAIGTFLMFSPLSNRQQQPVFLLLCTGLFLLAITDSLLSYYNFSGGFNTGTLQDVLWPVSMQLIGLAAITYLDSVASEQQQNEHIANTAPRILPLPTPSRSSQFIAIALTILPLILVLMTCALLLLRITPQGGATSIQSNLVVLVLVLILIVRQTLTLLENNRLIMQIQNELAFSQSELCRKRREAEEANRRIQEKQELEEGVAALRSTLIHIARGDFATRVPAISGPLQQIAVSLNMMLDQLSFSAQQNAHYKQVQQEFKIVQEAIERFEQGQSPWLSSQPPAQSTSELRAIFFGLLHVYTHQTNQWRNLESSLDSVHTLARHLRETLSKLRPPSRATFPEQGNIGGIVIDLAISEAAILEQQQENVVKQVAHFTKSSTSSTSPMMKIRNMPQVK
jgi:hypothetical protein